ncbi:MAG: murein L,D-transpeptidase, partial [Bacteroidetes bacterium]|nr:murein L,D-transpeptidase [Bacteroidota bacterium]
MLQSIQRIRQICRFIIRFTSQKHSLHSGLIPALFQTDDLRDLINKTDTTKLNYSQLAELELSLTKNYYHYAAGLQYGVFNPVELYPNDYFIAPQRPDSAFIHHIFSNPDSLSFYLKNVQPNGKEYKALQTELKKLKSLKDSTFTPIPLLS